MTGLKCPECGGATSRVVIVRAAPDSLRRRRRCDDCGGAFTTHETVASKKLTHGELTDRLRKARAKIQSLQRTPEDRKTDSLLARANREKKR